MDLSSTINNLKKRSFWVIRLANLAAKHPNPNAMTEAVTSLINQTCLPESVLDGNSDEKRAAMNNQFHEDLKKKIIVNGVVRLEKLNEVINKIKT